ncbi:amidohydrolase [Arenicella xantha]
MLSMIMSTAAQAETNLANSLSQIEPKLIEWRRHLHANPELSNREVKTAKYVADHLQKLGLEVQTGVAHTGVVAILEGGLPGPLVALRADMDALPVTEQVDLPFASKVTDVYRGESVGVMHACGHDTHVAILMAAAELLVAQRESLQGRVMFIFQPAEEGAPEGEEGGAELMLKEGLFKQHKPDAVFGLHTTSSIPVGMIGMRAGPMMAASDKFEITVKGRQTHGSRPWGGIDPIVVSAQIINSMQTIVSRQSDITKAPAVVSVGAIKGGVRNNIIPESVNMVGTIRNFDMQMREDIHRSLERIVLKTAEAQGAEVEFDIDLGYPVTVNNPELTAKMRPTLERVFGAARIVDPGLITGAEDFSYYALETPGLFFFLGGTPAGVNPATAPSNHSPLFYVDESALISGVQALVELTLDYQSMAK